jgi:general secretion pathway protein G
MSSIRRPSASHRAGFTILELMVVMVIIGILMAAFVFSGASIFRDAVVRRAQTQMTQLSAMLEEFRQIENIFPDDRLSRSIATNVHNSGSEALFLAFFDQGYSGRLPNQDWLVNTDNDVARKSVTRLPNRDLFEIGDPWGNPVVYFYSLHYEDVQTVIAGADGFMEEQNVRAARNETTGAFVAPTGFQLISAGQDGEFGTEDDLLSYGG